ncbi:MAG: hypothetical protein H0V29_07405 [Thermoleophilaceae bacterium]|nr:hypothetical protein [Thermoleophilaceae bacterium]
MLLVPASSASAARCQLPDSVTTQSAIDDITVAKTTCRTALRAVRVWDNSDLCRELDACKVKASARWRCHVISADEVRSSIRCAAKNRRRVSFTSQL